MSRMIELAERLGSLTPSMLQALTDFEPGVWYGPAKPTPRAAAHKGHMVRLGLVEHDGAAPQSNYRLTSLGEEARARATQGEKQ